MKTCSTIFLIFFLTSCALGPREPTEREMGTAIQEMLYFSASYAAQQAGVTEYADLVDQLVGFKKRECIKEPDVDVFYCSFDSKIITMVPTQTTPQKQLIEGTYHARFLKQQGNWMVQGMNP